MLNSSTTIILCAVMVGVVTALVRSCSINLIGAQKRSGFVAALLTLTAFGHAKARRDG
jgi:ABC-type transporter Mla maintaining outer membrane lipid asymmetry permease subunit MlaE